MYAVIETGGKQYRVQEGDVVHVEKLNNETGETVIFDKVLAVSKEGQLACGMPYLQGSTVEGKIIKQGKSKKIIVFKFKPKKNYRRKQGHRQPFTRVQIEKINVSQG